MDCSCCMRNYLIDYVLGQGMQSGNVPARACWTQTNNPDICLDLLLEFGITLTRCLDWIPVSPQIGWCEDCIIPEPQYYCLGSGWSHIQAYYTFIILLCLTKSCSLKDHHLFICSKRLQEAEWGFSLSEQRLSVHWQGLILHCPERSPQCLKIGCFFWYLCFWHLFSEQIHDHLVLGSASHNHDLLVRNPGQELNYLTCHHLAQSCSDIACWYPFVKGMSAVTLAEYRAPAADPMRILFTGKGKSLI